MNFQVRADDVFWRAVDQASSELKVDIYRILFSLVEFGIPPNASRTSWAAGPVLVPAETIDLPDRSGFIVCVRPETLGHDYIYVARLVYYDSDDE